MIRQPKIKKPSRKKWIKKLDDLISKIVILRDKKCVICGSKTKLTCGHLFSRSHYFTRFDLINCNCQCWPCNFKSKRDNSDYTLWFVKNYGLSMYEDLKERFDGITHYKINDLEEMYQSLSKTYQDLKNK